MMEKIPKYERLLNLISYLLKSPTPVTWADIRGNAVGYDDDADDASVKRRFERDKDELRAMGVPVEFVQATRFTGEGYIINKGNFFLPPIAISTDEALALSVVAAGLAGAKRGVYAEARSALLKLVASMPAQVDAIEFPDEKMVLSLGLPTSRKTEKLREDLAGALARRKSVSFIYHSPARERPRRTTADPYGLAVWSGGWYLVGMCREHGEIRVWNVERFASNLKFTGGKTGPDYRIPKDFDIRRYVGPVRWQLHEKGKPMRAKVIFHPDIAWMIEESRRAGAGSAGEVFRRRKDGWGELEVRATDPQALVKWVLKFGRNARITGPPSLVKLAAGTLRRAIESY